MAGGATVLQLRLIWLEEVAVAVTEVGAAGAAVQTAPPGGVVAFARVKAEPPAASTACTA